MKTYLHRAIEILYFSPVRDSENDRNGLKKLVHILHEIVCIKNNFLFLRLSTNQNSL